MYAEAADGRPVFVLPFGDATLIGTTDERYEGDPAAAVATSEEIDYLLATVNELVPQANLTQADVDLHYCGVRPLPYVAAAAPASVTRRHSVSENPAAAMPFFSIIGGKLTTSRSLGQEVTATLLGRLGRPVVATSENRPLPGAAGYPPTAHDEAACRQAIADRLGFSPAQVLAAWQLYGTQTEAVLGVFPEEKESLAGTDLPGCSCVIRFATNGLAVWMISLSGD